MGCWNQWDYGPPYFGYFSCIVALLLSKPQLEMGTPFEDSTVSSLRDIKSQYSTNTHTDIVVHTKTAVGECQLLRFRSCRNFVLVKYLITNFSLFLKNVMWLTVSSIEYQQDSLKAAISIPIISYYWFEESNILGFLGTKSDTSWGIGGKMGRQDLTNWNVRDRLCSFRWSEVQVRGFPVCGTARRKHKYVTLQRTGLVMSLDQENAVDLHRVGRVP